MSTTKITKRQYEAKVARLNALKVQLEDVRDNMIKAINDGIGLDADGLAHATNNMHDAISEIEQHLDDLESTFSRRNWTAADYRSAELIAANVD
jgi:glutathionyl-hydroquinone reductase